MSSCAWVAAGIIAISVAVIAVMSVFFICTVVL
jgi:hypothetical protein